MSTENIVKFLQTAYSNERLAALRAHCEDGKLAYDSCCCLVGIPTATGALKSARPKYWTGWDDNHDPIHNIIGRQWPFGREAESEFSVLGDTDAERQERLLPLILAEQERRESIVEAVHEYARSEK